MFTRWSPIVDQVYFKLASAHYAAGDLNLASANYALAAEAARDRDTRFLALQNVGRVEQRLENWDKAAEAWHTLAEEFPGREASIEALFNLGFCYTQSGRFELAWEVYRRIPGIAVNEEQRGRAHYWSGAVLKNLGRYDEAIREFLRVPYLQTGGMWGVTAKLEAAGAYEMTKRFDEAERIYRAVLESHGPDSDWGRIAAGGLERIDARRNGDGKDR